MAVILLLISVSPQQFWYSFIARPLCLKSRNVDLFSLGSIHTFWVPDTSSKAKAKLCCVTLPWHSVGHHCRKQMLTTVHSSENLSQADSQPAALSIAQLANMYRGFLQKCSANRKAWGKRTHDNQHQCTKCFYSGWHKLILHLLTQDLLCQKKYWKTIFFSFFINFSFQLLLPCN